MNHNQPAGHPQMPPNMMPNGHYPRRQESYNNYIAPPYQHHQQAYHAPYPVYHHPQQQYNVHVPPMHNPYMQQYYQPQQYSHYIPPPPPQQRPQYHQQHSHQGPLVVSSQSYSPHIPHMVRQPSYGPPPPMPVPFRAPQPEPSGPSVHPQQMVSPTLSHTQTAASLTTPPIQPMHMQPRKSAINEAPSASPTPQLTSLQAKQAPFHPILPWCSVEESLFPPRIAHRRRKRVVITADQVELPLRQQSKPPVEQLEVAAADSGVAMTAGPESIVPQDIQQIARAEQPDPVTPSTSAPPSEVNSTNPTTPSSSTTTATIAPTSQTHKRTTTKGAIIPIVPIKPVLPLKPLSPAQPRPATKKPLTPAASIETTANIVKAVVDEAKDAAPTETDSIKPNEIDTSNDVNSATEETPTKAAPSSWAALFASRQAALAANAASATATTNASITNGVSKPKANTMAEALHLYKVENEEKIPFLEPRGLVNTGNMCYMNSILQVLVFCVPFFTFLDLVRQNSVHSLGKSDTPLIDAMIEFMREFKIIDSATNINQLRMRLKDNELEQYGDTFIPEMVYVAIKNLPRFAEMKRGHQQDAQEFLGFLLDELHEECEKIMRKQASAADSAILPPADGPDGWLEVGHKQKASTTQSTGSTTQSPITKIFGGMLRSEFRVPGLQPSVTLESYSPLQLDIGAHDIHNITDALRNLTKSETLTGNFNSPRGATNATKQVFIDQLPPVLILHLKRFQYDNAGGTQKIWKKIGYPLELQIPKEVFPPNRRAALMAGPQGLPMYRLISVVYHHGRNASGGHYTVDVRRQEGREWIRLDDTVISRVRNEDVANEGGEEDPKVLAKALEQHKNDSNNASKNLYAGFEDGADEDEDNDVGWSQVNGHAEKNNGHKKYSSVANATTNGSATPSTVGKQTPKDTSKYGLKDNKSPYLLIYQSMEITRQT